MIKSIVLALVFLLAAGVPAHATNIKEVTSGGGIKAWLVEDHKLPIVSMRFAFRGGVEQDPVDKQGLAMLSMRLMAEGAGPYDAAAFQQRLADHSITIDFSAGRDALSGTFRSLSKDRKYGADLLGLALAAPRTDMKDFTRARDQQLSTLRAQLSDPNWQARYALFREVFANHPYGLRSLGSTKTLTSLTQKDVKTFIHDHLAQDNVIVAVAGDITEPELSDMLDETFGKLPKHAELKEVKEVVWPSTPKTILTQREGTQTELLFAMPAPKEDDPDWYAAEIANYIVGGGGFSARLMQDVRDKKGLTYGIYTTLSPADHAGLFIGSAATDNPKTKEAWDVAADTMRRFYEDGATEKEINAAKDYLTGSIPLELTSTQSIAAVMVELQMRHRGTDYLDKSSKLIRDVPNEDVQAAIRKWFNPDRLTLSMVGKPASMPPTETYSLMRE